MKTNNLTEAIETIKKNDLPVKQEKSTSFNRNLPQIRKVALAKRNVKFVMLVALFVSCFSLSVFVGYFGPFLLFK